MADPEGYDPDYSFSGFQANNPSTPLPAPRLDAELAAIAASIGTMVAAILDVRRSDGALKNNIVTFDALHESLQFLVDPTNGELVAAAVASAQAAAVAADGSATEAAAQAAASAASAAEAAASAGTVNLSNYLSKAGNLAGLGSNETALSNIGAMKVDGSTAIGRLAPTAVGQPPIINNWNGVTHSGWYHTFSAANQPSYLGVNDWLVQVVAFSESYVTQIAYPFLQAAGGSAASVLPFRRHSYDNAGTPAWTPWISVGSLPIGTSLWINSVVVPTGFVKENGALLPRATYPELWTYAQLSGNIVDEATWSAGNTGAFSTGDLSTTFRIPDARGEFIRGYDDGRGVDAGRFFGLHQADSFKSHSHGVIGFSGNTAGGNTLAGTGGAFTIDNTTQATGGAETRPRNNAKLAIIKAY